MSFLLADCSQLIATDKVIHDDYTEARPAELNKPDGGQQFSNGKVFDFIK